MAGALVERWRSWRAQQREERLERLGQQLQAGGTPVAGGFVFKLFAIAIIIAIVVGVIALLRSGLNAIEW